MYLCWYVTNTLIMLEFMVVNLKINCHLSISEILIVQSLQIVVNTLLTSKEIEIYRKFIVNTTGNKQT